MATTETPVQLATIPFGTRNEVKELQARIVQMLPSLMPNSAALNPTEALALAQVALAHGLSPFNNEIYYLKSGDRNLGVFPGIRGYRKAAHRQIKRDGGSYWLSEPLYATPTEYGGEAGDTCVVYELRDSVTMGEYLRLRGMIMEVNRLPSDILKMAKEDSATLTSLQEAVNGTALSILGTPPIVRGVGIVKKYEAEGRLKKAGLNPIHIAKIRAERAALRLRFDLDLIFGGGEDQWQETEMVDGQTELLEEETAHIEAPGNPEQSMKELGFTPKEEKPADNPAWTAEQKAALIDAKLADNDFAAAGMLGLSNLPTNASKDAVLSWGKVYRARRKEINPATKKPYLAPEAAEWANNGGK